MRKKTLIIAVLMLASALLILAPYTIRAIGGNPYIVNSQAYLDLHLYSQNSSYDISQKTPINILNELNLKDIYIRIASVILGVLSVLLGYLVLKKKNMTDKNIWAVLMILITSPIFIYTFMNYNPLAFTIALSLLVMLIDNDILKSVVFAITPFIDIYGAIVGFIFLMIYMATDGTLKKSVIFVIISAMAVFAGIATNYVYGFNVLNGISFETHNMITDIGADIGFSFSSIVLSIIGIIILWERGLRNFVIHSVILLFVFIAAFNTTIRLYLNLVLVVYAGFAYIYLTRRKWSIPIIKKVTLILIICSILFTTLVYMTRLVNTMPNSEYGEALHFLEEKSLPDEVILSLPSNGHMIRYYTKNPVFVDENSRIYEPANLEDFHNISSSRNLERTEALLHQHNITYIFIDKQYKEYLEEKSGLLFLLEESKRIIRVFNNTEAEIWVYAW